MKKKADLEGKLEAIKEMRDFASGLMKNGLKDKMSGLKKVTVASDSKKGLEEGLSKAKELMSAQPEMESSSEEETEELEESPSEEYDEVVEKCESPEEIDALIKKLEAKKQELASKE